MDDNYYIQVTLEALCAKYYAYLHEHNNHPYESSEEAETRGAWKMCEYLAERFGVPRDEINKAMSRVRTEVKSESEEEAKNNCQRYNDADV